MAKQLAADQRDRIVERLMDWGNLVFVGLVIVQLVPDPLTDPAVALAGILAIATAYWYSIRLMKGGGQ